MPKEMLEAIELRKIEMSERFRKKIEATKVKKKAASLIEDEKLKTLTENIKREKLRKKPTKWIKKITSRESSRSRDDNRRRVNHNVDEDFKVTDYMDNKYGNTKKRKRRNENVEEDACDGEGTVKKIKRRKSFGLKRKRIFTEEERVEDDERKSRQEKMLGATIDSLLSNIPPVKKPKWDDEIFIYNGSDDDVPDPWQPKSFEQLDLFFASHDPAYKKHMKHKNVDGSELDGELDELDDKDVISNDEDEAGLLEDSNSSELLLQSPLHDMVLSDSDAKTPAKKSTPRKTKEESPERKNFVTPEDSVNTDRKTRLKKNPESLKNDWPMLSKLGETLRQRKKMVNGSTADEDKTLPNGDHLEHSDSRNKKHKLKNSESDATPTVTTSKRNTKSSRLSNGNLSGNTSAPESDDSNRRKSRRSVGRASELASLRKAKYDV